MEPVAGAGIHIYIYIIYSAASRPCSLHDAGPFLFSPMIDGRHPVVEEREEAPTFQQNDLYLTECSSFHLITGSNMCDAT